MINVKINGTEYPTISINGLMEDSDWDNRETKAITFTNITYDEVKELLPNGAAWSIVVYDEIMDSETEEIIQTIPADEFDNSDFSLSGPITDNRDGSVTIKMGKLTELEEAYELLFGGEE